jgi:hypothetical protein
MKQETLEEVAGRLYPENIESIMDGYHDSNSYQRDSFINGARWQQERSYSKEEVLNMLNNLRLDSYNYGMGRIEFLEWFEQFKKK